jgi:class 3 adenylate cyclase
VPLDALAARAALAALLAAYVGRRSAARVQAGALRHGAGETIRAALLFADLRDFTALSEAIEPAAMIAALDAWFDRIAGAVQAFGGTQDRRPDRARRRTAAADRGMRTRRGLRMPRHRGPRARSPDITLTSTRSPLSACSR